MHVVIVGCGRVGAALAQQLTDDGSSSVAIIDRRQAAFHRLGDRQGIDKIIGVGFDRAVLIGAGIERADAVAAVTSGDNSNILVARVARENFGIDRVVARIYDPRRAAVYQRLGIATVATVSWTTEQVLRRLQPAPVAVEWTDPTGQVMLIEQRIPASIAGRRYAEFAAELKATVVAVSRLGATVVADGSSLAQEGDLVYLAVPASDIANIDLALTPSPSAARTETRSAR